MNISFIASYTHEHEAEVARENFLSGYNDSILDGSLYTIQDEIVTINNKYVVRILLSKPQMEFSL